MGKSARYFCAVLGGIVVLIVFGLVFFEMYPENRVLPPSKEALANGLLALERWLIETGHTVRVASRGSPQTLLTSPEKTVFIQTSYFRWFEDSWKTLELWVTEGGVLFVSVDSRVEDEPELAAFLAALGVGITGHGNQGTKIEADVAYAADFDRSAEFKLLPEGGPKQAAEIEILYDQSGAARLVIVRLGQGAVIVTGVPYFLYSDALVNPENARLAWRLLGGRKDVSPGILFIRERKSVPRFWGKLADRGNPVPLGTSAAVLLAIGFWTVIPGFGVFREDPVKPGRPLRERFLAEARFLKKYGVLEKTYTAGYGKAIARKLRAWEDFDEHIDPDRIAALIVEIQKDNPRGEFPVWDYGSIKNALDPQQNRDFPARIDLLTQIAAYLGGLGGPVPPAGRCGAEPRSRGQ